MMYTFKLKHGCCHVTALCEGDERSCVETEVNLISAFYMASNEGKIYVATDDGHCNDIVQLDGPNRSEGSRCRFLQYLVHYRKLICISDDLVLSLYDIDDHDVCQLHQSKSFKLSMAARDSTTIIHVFKGLLAVSNEQSMVRLFDVIQNDNYVLSLTDPRHKAAPNDTIDMIQFSPSSRVLLGVTAKNRIVQWKYRGFGWNDQQNESSNERHWVVLPPITLSRNALCITAGLSSHFYSATDLGLAVFAGQTGADDSGSTDDGELLLFCETKLHCIYSGGRTIIQFAPNRLLIFLEDDKMKKIRTPFTILIVACSGNTVFVSDGEQAQLYSVDMDGPPLRVREWKEMRCSAAALYSIDDEHIMNAKWNAAPHTAGSAAKSDRPSSINVIVSHHSNIRIYSADGALRTTLTFQEADGFPVAIDVRGSLLAAVTTENYLKIWDLGGDPLCERSQSAPKAVVPRRSLDEYVVAVKSIRINADYNKIGIVGLVPENMRHLSRCFHIYDIDRDQCTCYHFEREVAVEELLWDELDGRLLSVSWRKIDVRCHVAHRSETQSVGDTFDESADVRGGDGTGTDDNDHTGTCADDTVCEWNVHPICSWNR